MINRIDNKFKELRNKKKKALISFITSGDPNQKTSKKILDLLNNKNIDLIEIGFPFSDPMADGPTIQKSSQRAIKSKTNLESTFGLIKNFRSKESKTPIILMGYFNPVFQYGLKRFFKKCEEVGVDGLIIVDLPPEEDQYISKYAEEYNVHNIRLITPTTDKRRLKDVLKHASGFLYYVSVMGITGTKKPLVSTVKKSIKQIRKISKLPICVGFGISKKSQIQSLNKFADGCVIGSALVKFIEEFSQTKISEKKMLNNISDFLEKLQK